MKASKLVDVLKTLIAKQINVCVIGSPGLGKTSVVRQVAKDIGYDVIEKHLPTMLVEDFGIPYIDANGTTFSYRMPEWYPYEGKPNLAEKGILFFDDRNQANADIQKVLANIQQARTLHGVPLAKGWTVISTGNKSTDRAGANRILSHLSDREIAIEFDADLNDSCQWALANGVHPAVVAFWRFRPDNMYKFDPNQDKNPTMRSWTEGISPLIGTLEKSVELEVFKGRIGEAAATEFSAFLGIYESLPNIDMLLMKPDTAEVPKKGNVLYAVAAAIAHRANKDNIDKVLTYSRRMPQEFSVMVVSDILSRDQSLATTKPLMEWFSSKESDILV